MKSSAKKIQLETYDDIFQTDASRAEDMKEKVAEVPLAELHPFKDHPFQVRDDDAMKETVESISKYGVLVPAIVRCRAEGGYELISGHRRKRGCELAGKEYMPVLVRDLDDDEATIIMVDSNLQRETLLFSEKAFAYKMKVEAIKRKSGRPEIGSRIGTNSSGKRTYAIVGEQSGESRVQIYRYIRLTELVPELLRMVDERVDDLKIGFSSAVELSYLKHEEQIMLLDIMEKEVATPSLSQALRLKKHSQKGTLTLEVMDSIMSEEKKEVIKVTLNGSHLKKYFPQNATPLEMENVIIRLLEEWRKRN